MLIRSTFSIVNQLRVLLFFNGNNNDTDYTKMVTVKTNDIIGLTYKSDNNDSYIKAQVSEICCSFNNISLGKSESKIYIDIKGVDEYAETDIRIFPNMISDIVIIESDDGETGGGSASRIETVLMQEDKIYKNSWDRINDDIELSQSYEDFDEIIISFCACNVEDKIYTLLSKTSININDMNISGTDLVSYTLESEEVSSILMMGLIDNNKLKIVKSIPTSSSSYYNGVKIFKVTGIKNH